jgi:hypothetical protein
VKVRTWLEEQQPHSEETYQKGRVTDTAQTGLKRLPPASSKALSDRLGTVLSVKRQLDIQGGRKGPLKDPMLLVAAIRDELHRELPVSKTTSPASDRQIPLGENRREQDSSRLGDLKQILATAKGEGGHINANLVHQLQSVLAEDPLSEKLK